MLNAAVEESEAVLRLLTRGTADLEIEHRLLGPSGDEVNFSADKRQLLGLCRVGEMRGSSREFRMARGSLLQRRLGRDEVRGAAARAVREASSGLSLPPEVQDGLSELGSRLRAEGIVDDAVTLELLSPPGQSLLGLLGLAVGSPGTAIPLSLAGQGAQRLASYVLATELAVTPPLVVMDEVELGLEPYRQRLLIQRLSALMATGGQAFLTTHSPVVLGALDITTLHRLDPPRRRDVRVAQPAHDGTVDSCVPDTCTRQLDPALARVQLSDPEALLCRLPLVCEGATEVAVLAALLDGLAMRTGYGLSALGIQLVDGGGQPNAFKMITALRKAGFALGVFLDEEPAHTGSRRSLDSDSQIARGFFSAGSCTEMALAATLPEPHLEELLDVVGSEGPRPREGRRQQLGEALELEHPHSVSEALTHRDIATVRTAIGECAHRYSWFKPRLNAQALASWLSDGRLPAAMTDDLNKLWERICTLLAIQDKSGDATHSV
jgi:putative ATP-dependent endonuclease of OLD family